MLSACINPSVALGEYTLAWPEDGQRVKPVFALREPLPTWAKVLVPASRSWMVSQVLFCTNAHSGSVSYVAMTAEKLLEAVVGASFIRVCRTENANHVHHLLRGPGIR